MTSQTSEGQTSIIKVLEIPRSDASLGVSGENFGRELASISST